MKECKNIENGGRFMKKLLLLILILGIFSCSKKNVFEEIQTDMNQK